MIQYGPKDEETGSHAWKKPQLDQTRLNLNTHESHNESKLIVGAVTAIDSYTHMC